MHTHRHFALNTLTGELIGCNHGTHLKREVARTQRWNVRHGYGAGKWIFFHCTYAQMRERYQARLAQRG